MFNVTIVQCLMIDDVTVMDEFPRKMNSLILKTDENGQEFAIHTHNTKQKKIT